MRSVRSAARGRRVQARLSSFFLIRNPSQGNLPPCKLYLRWEADTKQFQLQTKQSSLARYTVYDCLLAAVEGLPPFITESIFSAFLLQEDITILVELSALNRLPDDPAFIRLEQTNLLERNAWSLKQRYQYFTRWLGEDDMYSICRWVQMFGAIGFASFRHKRLRICMFEWFDMPEDRPDWLLGRVVQQNVLKEKKEKGKKYSSFQDLISLNQIIIIYSNLVRRPINELLGLLHQFSGDFSQLDDYLETGNGRFLWSHQDDNLLYSQKLKNSHIQRYIPKEEIAQRQRYLGIKP